MIEATELRMGNWIKRCEPYNDYGYISTIGTSVFVHHSNGGAWHYLNQIYPIPLTPKLLEQLGFEKSGSNYENDDIELMEWIDGFMLLNGEARSHWNLTYKHLHELQNVYYWLTKKELQFTPSAPQSPNT